MSNSNEPTMLFYGEIHIPIWGIAVVVIAVLALIAYFVMRRKK